MPHVATHLVSSSHLPMRKKEKTFRRSATRLNNKVVVVFVAQQHTALYRLNDNDILLIKFVILCMRVARVHLIFEKRGMRSLFFYCTEFLAVFPSFK